MIGVAPQRAGWARAATLSLLIHAAAAGALIWQPDWRPTQPPAPPGQMRLELSVPTPHPQSEAPILSPVSTPLLTPSEPGTARPGISDTASILPLQGDAILHPQPVATAPAGDPAPRPDAFRTPEARDMGSDAPAADPRLGELFNRIRAQLAQSCLLALPALLEGERIQLGILAADDRRIAQLMRDLTAGLDSPVSESAVLLDRRQCPALDFARLDPRYPLPGLGLQIESQEVASGDNLRGQISGGAGLDNSLLLIDDNGVVHDLRRFQLASAGVTRFDVPLARSGPARDTHQLLLAIASPARPQAIAANAGHSAEDFFARLAREIGPDTRIGIASLYLR